MNVFAPLMLKLVGLNAMPFIPSCAMRPLIFNHQVLGDTTVNLPIPSPKKVRRRELASIGLVPALLQAFSWRKSPLPVRKLGNLTSRASLPDGEIGSPLKGSSVLPEHGT
jgi:hypothetical protein